jgi:ABC-type glycerol-3-phosphate transport system substrate-binding protein
MRRGRDEHCWEAVLDGEVTPAMAEHLAACADCRRRVAGFSRATRAVAAQAPPLPEGLDDRVLAAVAQQSAEAEPAARRGRPRLRFPAVRLTGRHGLAAGLATLAAAVAVALALHPALGGNEARAVPIVPLTADCGTMGRTPDPHHLVVAGVWHGAEAKSFARVLQRFEDRTGIDVTFAYESRNIAATLQARLNRGCAPDVAVLPQPGLLGDLARRGQIRPLDARTRAVVWRNYGRTWRDLATVDGRLYGVWFKAADKSTFWYRPQALARAGIDATPRTWDELVADAHRLAAAGVQPLSVAGAGPWTLTDWFENLYLRSAGPVRYQLLSEHRLRWTDPSVVAALRRLAQLFGDPRLVGTPAQSLETSFEESVQHVFGRRPTAAMVYEADFVRSFLPAGDQAASARFFAFPTVPGGTSGAAVVGGDVAVAFSGSAAAQRLVRFLATPDAAAPWARAGGFLSPNRAVAARAYPDPLARAAAAALARARTVRFDLSDLQPPAFGATAEQGMWKIFQDFLADPSDPEATARRLEDAAAAAWACQRAIAGRC